MFGLAGTEPLIVTEAWAHPGVSENHGDEACVDLHEGVAAPRQYGAHPAAMMVYLLHHQLLPGTCPVALMTDPVGVQPFIATTVAMSRACGARSSPL